MVSQLDQSDALAESIMVQASSDLELEQQLTMEFVALAALRKPFLLNDSLVPCVSFRLRTKQC